MPQAALLDTSAFRALSEARLAYLSKGTALSVSPFCFWELLTHLEDQGQFARVKGNLMKFRYVVVLDDPWASVELGVVLPDDAVHQRADDSSLIYAILAALRDSASVAEFYAKYAQDNRNQLRMVAGCVARAREVLEAEERRFGEYVSTVMKAVREGLVSVGTPTDRHRGTLEIAAAWWIQLGARAEQSQAARDRLLLRTYIYSSYVLHLAADYVRRGALTVDRNDFEDAEFCQHLALDSDIAAVTADTTLLRCLQMAIQTVNESPDASYHTRLHAVSIADLAPL